MQVNFDIQLTEGQRVAYDLAHKPDVEKLVLCYSRQSGKSILCEILLIEYLLKPNTFNAYISPTFQLGRKVYKEITQLLSNTGFLAKANASTLTIETTFGSTLQFFSAEAYTAIRGNTIKGICVIDECAFVADVLPNGENLWGNVIQPITKVNHPLVVLVSTPRGKQGFFYDFCLRGMTGEKGIAFVKRTIYDDNLVTPEEIEEIKKSIPPKAFQQEFECEFLDSSLTFFEGFEKCFKTYTYGGERQYIGCDLSANGTDETIVAKVNERNETDIIKIEGTLDQKYRKIAEIIDNSSPVAVYIENNGIGSPMINEIKKISRYRNRIHEWSTTNASKEDIITEMAVKIANGEVSFNSSATELYSQMGTFICKISKTKKLTFAAQDGKKDDQIMATAIALKCKEDYKFNTFNNISFSRGGNSWIK